MFEISAADYQLLEFIEVFGQRFVGLIDNQGVYSTYRVPRPEAPYPQDYIIDQDGIVRYWSDEFDAQKIISRIDHLLNTEVNEHDPESHEALSLEIIPNPFSKLTHISFEVGSRQKTVVSTKIYDITGRVVRSFHSMPNAQRPVQISWDGTDYTGNRMPSGIYFVRFELGEYSVTESIVLSR